MLPLLVPFVHFPLDSVLSRRKIEERGNVTIRRAADDDDEAVLLGCIVDISTIDDDDDRPSDCCSCWRCFIVLPLLLLLPVGK